MNLPETLLQKLRDPLWRLNNLYFIKDKLGNKVQFKMNRVQKRLFEDNHNQQIVLKARQQGVTTYYAILWLDACFWSKNGVNAGIIAHRREDSELIFFDKVRYAYDNMPEFTRCFNQASNDSVRELRFRNGSTFRVSTSMRGRTLQYLHISEFGKICKTNPMLAEEIVTGSLNAVDASQYVAIESTAEGKEGYFYDFCKEARRLRDSNVELSPMDMRFFFFPWYDDPSYKLEPRTKLSDEQEQYFDELGVELSPEQKEWYVKKYLLLGEKMHQEFPSSPEEAFMQSTDGFWYADTMKYLYDNNRIGDVPHNPNAVVHVAFDLGVTDHTAIWFFQIDGGGVNFINYFEDNNQPYHFYARKLQEISMAERYTYGMYFFPHDVAQKEQSTNMRRKDVFTSLGIPVTVVPNIPIIDGIQAVRAKLPMCKFDSEKCKKGIRHIETYKKEWSNKFGTYVDKPVHDHASHCADSLRYACLSIDKAKDPNDRSAWDRLQKQWKSSSIGV